MRRGVWTRSLRQGEAGPLAGLPLLVKDITDVGGMRTTYGSLLHVDTPAVRADALVVARLQAAGAIVVGKSNTPEFACAGFTANRVFGPTRNPWNPERTPGGSSGGSAAAITSGMVSIATSTDTGGSIRIPASYCGLVGLKPTNGLVPRDPAARAMDWIDLTTDGPMGSTVDDVRLQLRVLSDAASVGASVQQSLKPRRTSRLLVLKRWTSRVPLPNEDATLFGEAVTHLCSITGLDPEPMAASELFPGIEVGDDWALVAAPELLSIVGGRDSLELVRDRLHPTTAAFAGGARDRDRRGRAETLAVGHRCPDRAVCGEPLGVGLYDNVLAPTSRVSRRYPCRRGCARTACPWAFSWSRRPTTRACSSIWPNRGRRHVRGRASLPAMGPSSREDGA